MRVSQYMSRPVITITPQTEFHQAFDLMRARRIHHLPVVDNDRVVGIVAERDLLLAAAHFGSAEVPVGDIMCSPPVCISDRTHLKQAARLLVTQHIGSLPVLNSRKALVGMITETDIFKITAGMLHAHPLITKAAKKLPRVGAARKVAPAAKPVKGAATAKPVKGAAAPKAPRRSGAR